MVGTKRPRARYNVKRIVADMTLLGWNSVRLGEASGLSSRTIDRFLDGEVQTAKTLAAIANALNKPTSRYLSHVEEAVA